MGITHVLRGEVRLLTSPTTSSVFKLFPTFLFVHSIIRNGSHRCHYISTYTPTSTLLHLNSLIYLFYWILTGRRCRRGVEMYRLWITWYLDLQWFIQNAFSSFFCFQHRGWEPQAILNWLALAGWGAKHEATAPITDGSDTDSSSSSRPSSPHRLEDAPDSTHLMTIDEMISDFDLSALTHRSSVLDGTKLEYINKHHLMRTWSTPEGLDKLANRVHGHLKDAFKSRLVVSTV